MGRIVRKITLKQNIIYLLVLGWGLPVIVLITLLATYVDSKANEQMMETVNSSVEKAVDMFNLQLNQCEISSKNASYYSDIRDAYLTYYVDSNTRGFDNKIKNFLNMEYKYNDVVKSAVLDFTGRGKLFHTYNNSAEASYKNIEFFHRHAKEPIEASSESLYTGTMLYSTMGHTYLVRNLMLANYKSYAMLSLELNETSFLEGFKSVWGASDVAVLLDGVYMMGNENLIEEYEKDSFRYFADYSYTSTSWKQYNHELTAIIQLDNSIIYQKITGIWLIFILLALAMIPLIVVVFRFFNWNVITPEEIAMRDAKIMALQSQINPHFLNNTFEIINWEARLNGNIKVSKMIEALSTMLEATMNRDGEHMHSLARELAYVDAYAYIITERLGDRFNYVKDIESDEVLDIQIPKLIIQPIVENAVEHGLSEVQKGDIKICVYEKNEYIFIEVINDGVMSEKDQDKIRQLLSDSGTEKDKNERSLNLGIRNVNNRIKLIFGSDCGLKIENRDDKFTVSTIIVKNYQKQQFNRKASGYKMNL